MYKVLVVGEDGAGKRSLLDAVTPSSDSEWLRTGVHVRHWTCRFDAKLAALELELLDVPADPRMCTALNFLFANVAAILFVYDLSDENAFTSLIRRWQSTVVVYEFPLIVFVATKRDRIDDDDFAADVMGVPRVESETIAKHWNVALHVCVSADADRVSVRRFFVKLCRLLARTHSCPRIDPLTRRRHDSTITTTRPTIDPSCQIL